MLLNSDGVCQWLLHLLHAVSCFLLHWRLRAVTTMLRRPREEQNTCSHLIFMQPKNVP